jgi:SAM-dependent methyltransferase
VKKSARVAAFDARPRVLHIDGGREYLYGWINANMATGRHELAFDAARAGAHALALPDASVDGIHLSHVLERVRDAQPLFDELWRVAKPGAKLFVRVPHGARPDAVEDPASQRAWHEGSFAHFGRTAAGCCGCGDWQLEATGLLADERGTPRELVVSLNAIKPARPRGDLHPAPLPPLQHLVDHRVDPAFHRI